MKNKWIGCLFLIIIINLGLTVSPLFSQNKTAASVNNHPPLTLANIFNALTGTSSKLPIAKRNQIATQKVLELGIDFSLTPDIEKELRKAKASEDLIAAIRQKSKIVPSTQNSVDNELNYWDSIKESQNEEDLKSFLKKYPNGRFATLAKNRLQELADTAIKDTSSIEEIAPITTTDELRISGTWIGTRGLESSNAFLIISGSKGNQFTGILKLRGFHIAVQGQINQKTRQMNMQEMKIVETDNESNWTFSTFTGAISRDKKEMSGVMKDKADTTSKANIAWSFTKVD